jgi:hypothetical protein
VRHDPRLLKIFRPVADYYRMRLAKKGDVYGWGYLSGPTNPTALLLADPTAEDIPNKIGNVAIVVERIEAPEALQQ